MNPELLSITQSKEMGVWPPGDAVFVKGIYPYIKRLKIESVKVLDVGCMKGEISSYLLELDETEKIKKIDLVISGGEKDFEKVLAENIKGQSKLSIIKEASDEYDVVMINANAKNLDKTMRKYYSKLKSNGIFCGNDHNSPRVKEALSSFRREDKIGTPILVTNGSWFWYKR
jgi:2-polyprenyl-3-methyl-5-hydroxy-6-metoxy-1,4-benzoquinol methylase